MGTIETAFAIVVTVLAALAVIGALVFAVVWEICAIRRTLAAHREAAGRPLTDEDFWRQQRVLNEPQ
jgi:hypothetical protein